MKIARLDRDVVRRRGDLEAVVARMVSGDARILVGTQMVTKGHDFPNVTLVVVLNADQGLFSTDFRAPERLAQTIVQVAGRAGRGNKPGEVLIQTEFPEHPLLQRLLSEGYDGFAQAALAEREQAQLAAVCAPGRAARLGAKTREAALGFLTEARALAGARSPGLRLLGPVPAAMAKRAGRYHAQLLIESAERARLHTFLDRWLPQVEQLQECARGALVARRRSARAVLAGAGSRSCGGAKAASHAALSGKLARPSGSENSTLEARTRAAAARLPGQARGQCAARDAARRRGDGRAHPRGRAW